MTDAVDPQLWDQQAGFHRGRSCTDQIATLCIILEQSCEWNSPLYVNLIGFEKTLGSLADSLWEIPSINRNSYSIMTCRGVCGGQLADAFQVNTGVRQGCDWVLKTFTVPRGNGIRWTT